MKTLATTFRRLTSAPWLLWISLAILLGLTPLGGCWRKTKLPPSPVVTLAQGKLQGSVDSQGVYVFKGVPFAKPPLGNLRWAPPQPPDPWGTEVLDATEYAPMCVQVTLNSYFSKTQGDEDCLKLNIWTTSVNPETKLPVLVFIHSGGHMSGSSSGNEWNGVPFYIGSNMARSGPAVVVTITHRLGVLGFIGHRGLSKTSGYGGSGNYGYMDQIRALEWVRDNIAQFGGDPQKVMIFGQSAGATGTLVLLASPKARGLFRSAIIHSMAAFTYQLTDVEKKGELVENSLGCTNDDPEKAIACMRSRGAKQVTTSVSNDLTMSGSGVIFGPNVDGYVLPETIMKIVRSGKENPVPVIVGSTADEFTTIAPVMLPHKVDSEEEYQEALASYFATISYAVPTEAIRAAYPSAARTTRKAAMIDMVADFVYTCPTRMVSRALGSTHKAPVRRFLYTHTLSSSGWKDYGAGHGFELSFLFGPIPKGWYINLDPAEQELSRQMIRAWVNFANYGSPEGAGFDWPIYKPESDNYLILDSRPSIGSGFRQTQCDFWQQYESKLYP